MGSQHYADDAEKRRFNVEMQVTLQKFLPKRSRYYHDQIDMDALLAGDSYENLPDTYVTKTSYTQNGICTLKIQYFS